MIRAERLSKRFRKVTALCDVTFEVPEGSVFALIGPNGAGKSTLFKTLVNIISPDSGNASILGVDSRRLGPAEFSRLGYVSENQHLPDWMTVRQFLMYSKRFYPTWDDALEQRLSTVLDLPPDQRLRELSRGLRMKAALVSSLAYRPRLLMLDEPFSGLDVLVRDEIAEAILAELEDCTIVLASHDLADIESFASHVCYLSEGSVLFTEELPSLLSRYRRVEVTMPNGPEPVAAEMWPPEWVMPEYAPRMVRFTDTRYDPGRVRRHFPGAQSVVAEPLSLRSIFVALARERRAAHGLAHS
ncbi:MAG: ABC transporter ATP-binding protein [Bryobacterales bacterium]|nr:ABC transporter ATP-binding protein [Bryobacterales bacterium]